VESRSTKKQASAPAEGQQHDIFAQNELSFFLPAKAFVVFDPEVFDGSMCLHHPFKKLGPAFAPCRMNDLAPVRGERRIRRGVTIGIGTSIKIGSSTFSLLIPKSPC
jgi:hypothetical protein